MKRGTAVFIKEFVTLSLLIAATLALTSCGKKMTGVYELDMAATMAAQVAQTSAMMSQMGVGQVQGMPDMQNIMKGMSDSMRQSYRIAFDTDKVAIQMGLMEIRGTYKVKDDIIYVTATGYGSNGQFPLYILDDDTIKYHGGVYKRN